MEIYNNTNLPVNLMELRDYLDHQNSERLQNLWDYPLVEAGHLMNIYEDSDIVVAIVKDEYSARYFEISFSKVKKEILLEID
jgi:hypothetical protein